MLMQEERLFEDDHSAEVYLMETHFAVTTSELKKNRICVANLFSVAGKSNQARFCCRSRGAFKSQKQRMYCTLGLDR